MQIALHATFDNADELAKFAELLAKAAMPVTPIKARESHEHKPAAETKPGKPLSTNQKIAEKTAKEAAAAEAPEAPAEEEAGEDSPLTPTYENMKAAVLLVNQKAGREPTEKLLKKYKGEKNGKLVVGQHIPKEFYGQIIDECNDILSKLPKDKK